jgi:hypothetical protein
VTATICSQLDCVKPVGAKGLCSTHYRRNSHTYAPDKSMQKRRALAKEHELALEYAVADDHDLQRRLRDDFLRRQQQRISCSLTN